MTVRLRRSLHRGSVLAQGLVLDTRLIGEAAARARILSQRWGELDVYPFDTIYVVRFTDPRRLRCDQALGAPLVRYGLLLSMAPLDPDEAAALAVGVELRSERSRTIIAVIKEWATTVEARPDSS